MSGTVRSWNVKNNHTPNGSRSSSVEAKSVAGFGTINTIQLLGSAVIPLLFLHVYVNIEYFVVSKLHCGPGLLMEWALQLSSQHLNCKLAVSKEVHRDIIPPTLMGIIEYISCKSECINL